MGSPCNHFLACLAPLAAEAACPMITDNARLSDAGACQVERWLRIDDGRLQIDTTYDNQFGRIGLQHWRSVGQRLISPPLF